MDLCTAVGYVVGWSMLFIVLFKYILYVVATSFHTRFMQQRFSCLHCVPELRSVHFISVFVVVVLVVHSCVCGLFVESRQQVSVTARRRVLRSVLPCVS